MLENWTRSNRLAVSVTSIAALAVVLAVAVSSELRAHWWILLLAAVVAAAASVGIEAGITRRSTPVDAGRTVRGHPSVPAAAVPVAERVPLRCTALRRSVAQEAAEDTADGYALRADAGAAAVAGAADGSPQTAGWTSALTAAYVAALPADAGQLRSRLLQVAAEYRDQPAARLGVGWWDKDRAGQPALASLAGLRVLRRGGELTWHATVVGDALVVQLRADGEQWRPVVAYPPAAAALDGSPERCSSLAAEAAHLPALRSVDGLAAATDAWLLMTGVLARWALTRAEAGEPVWTQLMSVDRERFGALVTAELAAGRLGRGGLTVVRVQLP